ncbi:MAG: hypothetical protein AAFO73_03445 [Pseudomonadota bacterium]
MAKLFVQGTKDYPRLKRVKAGDRIQFDSAHFTTPLVLDGLVGLPDKPIVLEPARKRNDHPPTFSSGMDEEKARLWSNRISRDREASGNYPTVAHLGDQALLILRNCQFVTIQSLNFDGCWPAAIYLDHCQNLAIHDVHFRSGTLAIGAAGLSSHDIVVQHCFWQQDTSPDHAMWNSIPWPRIHGASNNKKGSSVDVHRDYRHWDGDFFRAWDIAGNVTIRNNRITDTFNGIHFFNRIDALPPGVSGAHIPFNNARRSSRNVIIENNAFLRIRDNIFEPEDYAWNWVIRHNLVLDCYRPFSFELQRAAHIYVYGNAGSFLEPPSTKVAKAEEALFPGDLRKSPSLFKPNGRQDNEGPIYVVHNSWALNKSVKGILPKFALGGLIHANNAFQFVRKDKARFFGRDGAKGGVKESHRATEALALGRRFTRRFAAYRIAVDGDMANDQNFPDRYRSVGYRLGPGASGASPGFSKTTGTLDDPPDYTASHPDIQVGPRDGEMHGLPELAFKMPFGDPYPLPQTMNRGAVQTCGIYDQIDSAFGFAPDLSWLPKLRKPRPFPAVEEEEALA